MLRVFEICQKDTRRQCVRANDGEGGKAKMVVRQNCRGKKRQKLQEMRQDWQEAKLQNGKQKTGNKTLSTWEIWRKMLREIKLE